METLVPLKHRAGLTLAALWLSVPWLLAGCAGPGPIARTTPEQLVQEAGGSSSHEIWLEGPDSEGPEPGFKRVIATLSPIMVKCQQQAGTYQLVIKNLAFAGVAARTFTRTPPPGFSHKVITEINCKGGTDYLWGAQISYLDHRFAKRAEKDLILLNLNTQFLSGIEVAERAERQSELALKARRAQLEEEAKAASERLKQVQLRLAEERRLEDEQRKAYQAQLVSERPAFRAALKVGSRVRWIDHYTDSTREPAQGLVVELKRPLAQVQFDIPTGWKSTTVQSRWVSIDELAQPN